MAAGSVNNIAILRASKKKKEAEKSIDARENTRMYEKATRIYEKLTIHLAEVLRMSDPFDFAPALTSHSGFIMNIQTGGERFVTTSKI